MNQPERNSERDDLGVMQRFGASLADWSEKWFPDAYVFAGIAVAIVCAAALAMGRSPTEISVDFGKSFWNLIPFTMQMAFVVIGGYIVAVSAPVRRVIEVLARFPKSPKVAVAYVAMPGDCGFSDQLGIQHDFRGNSDARNQQAGFRRRLSRNGRRRLSRPGKCVGSRIVIVSCTIDGD